MRLPRWWSDKCDVMRRVSLLRAVRAGRLANSLLVVGAGDTLACKWAEMEEQIQKLWAEIWEALGE